MVFLFCFVLFFACLFCFALLWFVCVCVIIHTSTLSDYKMFKSSRIYTCAKLFCSFSHWLFWFSQSLWYPNDKIFDMIGRSVSSGLKLLFWLKGTKCMIHVLIEKKTVLFWPNYLLHYLCIIMHVATDNTKSHTRKTK